MNRDKFIELAEQSGMLFNNSGDLIDCENTESLVKFAGLVAENRMWPIMGFGRVAIGMADHQDGYKSLQYMDMSGEQRKIDADTTDLFPVGSRTVPAKVMACIHFKDDAAIRQTIEVLTEALDTNINEWEVSYHDMKEQRDTLREQLAALSESSQGLLMDVQDLINESEGVTGLHRNGDVAPWGELLAGGRFERLGNMDAVRKSLAAVSNDTPATEQPKRYFWGRPDSEIWRLCSSPEEAHGAAIDYINSNHMPGDEGSYEVGEACPALVAEDSESTRRQIADQIIEQLDQWAGENSGAEDETFDITNEERDELGNLVMRYVLSKANHQWFTSKEGTVTQHTYVAGSDERSSLWAINIPGPDEYHAAPSEEAAQHMAARHNAAMAEHLEKNPLGEHSPTLESISANAVPWPFGAESHAAELAEFDYAAWGLKGEQL